MLWQAIELWQAPVSWNFSLDEYFSGIFYIILGKKKKKKNDKGKKQGLGIYIILFPGLVEKNTVSSNFTLLSNLSCLKVNCVHNQSPNLIFFFSFPDPFHFGGFLNTLVNKFINQINNVNQYIMQVSI